MAEYIASAATAADGADFTLADGATASLNLFAAAGIPINAQVPIYIKTSSSKYVVIGELNSNTPALIVSGPGTFRASRLPAAAAFGVDKN